MSAFFKNAARNISYRVRTNAKALRAALLEHELRKIHDQLAAFIEQNCGPDDSHVAGPILAEFPMASCSLDDLTKFSGRIGPKLIEWKLVVFKNVLLNDSRAKPADIVLSYHNDRQPMIKASITPRQACAVC